MRKLIWLFIIALWLVPLGYIGYSYLSAPPEHEYKSFKAYMAITRQFIEDQKIDKSVVTGQQVDDEYTRIYADFLIIQQDVNQQLKKEKNFLILQIQPRNLASGASPDVSLEKAADFDKKIMELHERLETAIQDTVEKMNRLDKRKLKIFDVVSFVEGLEKGREDRTREFQEYLGLSQYVKAILEFVKSRPGYYTLSQDSKFLNFTSPQDQAYYVQLLAGANQYVKVIEDKIAKRTAEDRKNINAIGG